MKAYLDGGYNFVDVRDVAEGLILALENGKPGQCYILAGHYVSIKELMKYVEEITHVPAPKFKIARWFAYATGALSEIYYKIVKQKPLFTSYSVYTTGTNANFSIEKAKKEAAKMTESAKTEAAQIKNDMIAKASRQAEEALKEAESAAAKKMEAAKKEAGEEAGRLREKASELEKTAVDGVIQKLL